MLAKIFFRVGLLSDYRKTFWQMAAPALQKTEIEQVIHIGMVAHHLIQFTQECTQGTESASFYSQKLRSSDRSVDVNLKGVT